MQLVKLITHKRIKTLHCLFSLVLIFSLFAFSRVSAQDNSPYSRFGIGDLVPTTSTTTRGMAGITAGYTDYLSINFNNPGSFYNFQTGPQGKSNKISSGRIIFDVGTNFEQRKLIQSNPEDRFTASNALFSYAYIGVPLRKNWGMVFGLRPISRVSYKIFRNERLKDPITGLPIDSASTRFEGDGGSYLASLGTGLTVFRREKNKMEQNLSVGVNLGYFFGKKDLASKRTFINDTVAYYQGNFQTKTSFGNLNMNLGVQYRTPLNKQLLLTLGAYGTLGQNLNAKQDRIRETFVYDQTVGDIRLDSVSDVRNIKGKITMPASYTAGFVIQKVPASTKEGAWLIGLDLNIQNWEKYRFYGQRDSVRNKWELRLGTQLNPAPGKGYFSNVAYRAGIFFGPDYLTVGGKLPMFGISGGLALPIKNQNRLTPYQASIINLAFEYIRRGNSDNLVRENLFRFSIGFSLSDFWFIKRRYD